MTMNPFDERPLVLVMVGLPARGKSFTARRIARYTTWLGYRSKVFNVGSYRRAKLGAGQKHTFFDPANTEGTIAREQMADQALDDVLAWVASGGEVAVFDATNSTRERRARVRERCEAAGLQVVMVELVCDDRAVIEKNVRVSKVNGPDYAGRDPEEAMRDFMARLDHYQSVYETVDEPDASWIRNVDLGRRIELNRIEGHLPSKLVVFLMNVHILPRAVYLTRHGQSTFNVAGRIGGDSSLAASGQRYAANLSAWLANELDPSSPAEVWTSTLRRTVETGAHLGRPTRPWKLLDEIDAGACDGMTYEEIAERLPEEYAARKSDKLRYRYPRGESYQDLIARLEPVILELERHREPVVIVGHQAVLRALYAYLTGEPAHKVPHLPIPLHTVIKLVPGGGGVPEERFELGPIDATDGGHG